MSKLLPGSGSHSPPECPFFDKTIVKKKDVFVKTRKFVSSSLKYAILCARVSALPFPATSVSSELQSCNRLIHCGTLLMRR